MTATRHTTERGFTMIELVFALVIMLVILGAILMVTKSTGDLTEAARREMLATIEHGTALDALADLLRGAQHDSLDGFDNDGTALSPSFARVTGGTDGVPILTGAESLRWRSSSVVVEGVNSPGGVWWMDENGLPHLVVPDVPSGGFAVVQSGRDLTIHLTTFRSGGRGEVLQVTGSMSVALRN